MLKDYPLNGLNTWNVGGRCALYVMPRSRSEVRDAVLSAMGCGKELLVLGGGSNVLVSDDTLQALVLHMAGLDGIQSEDIGGGRVRLEIDAGYSVKKLLAYAVKNNLGGLEFLTGIPGTVGGALWGNAGACGEGFGPAVDWIEIIGIDAESHMLSGKDLKWDYRSCPCDADKALLISRCAIILKKSAADVIFERIRRFAELKKGQPLGRKTAGCVFKNPHGESAGRLLDAAGCKELRRGGARVSPSHANFVENDGGATAADIFELCEICRERVFSVYGIKLDYEIKFFGTFTKD